MRRVERSVDHVPLGEEAHAAAIGNPRSASMNTAIALASQGARTRAPRSRRSPDSALPARRARSRRRMRPSSRACTRRDRRGRPTRRACSRPRRRRAGSPRARCGIGEHALHVLLLQRDDVADDHRDRPRATAAVACHASDAPGNASSQTRRNAANAAAFTAAAMNAVTGVGAPSYTSGVHMWNGTAATLKQKPTSSSADASQQHRIVEASSPVHARADRRDIRRAGRAVHQRDPVQQESRRERAEQEILERRLGAAARCAGRVRRARRSRST